VALAALVAGVQFFTPAPAAADPAGDPGDVQLELPPRPSQAALDRAFIALVSQIPGMHIINPTITDNGGRMVCAYLDRHDLADTEAALRGDNPTFTPAEADAFVGDAEQVYCPSYRPAALSPRGGPIQLAATPRTTTRCQSGVSKAQSPALLPWAECRPGSCRR
jgi:hypothetical protein